MILYLQPGEGAVPNVVDLPGWGCAGELQGGENCDGPHSQTRVAPRQEEG